MASHFEDRGLVAITGANGTIGYASVIHALKTGYRVRCILRREDAVETIRSGPSVQCFSNKVEYTTVPDNTIPGAYDSALAGADYVVHIAGVWPKPNYHPDNEIYFPFVRSMENILSAAEKSGTVRRIVFTQAGAALVNTDDGNTLGTNMSQILNEHVKVNRTSAAFRPPLPSPHHAYCGAKAYCMTHLLSLRNSGQLPFSIIQVIPGTVIGPSEIVTTASQAYAQMDRMSKALLFNEPKPQYAFGFVHLNDCAAVHINSLDEVKVPESDVPDWFIAASTTPEGMEGKDVWREAGNVVERNFGKEVESGLFTVGRENMPVNMPYRVDSTLTERMLLEGAKFRSLGDCVREMGEWYRGLVEQEKGTQASTVQ